jgi:transcription initiation factor TFIIA large subunit
MKMMQAGVVSGPIERLSGQKSTPAVTPVHDLNVPYEGTEEYETPTAEMLFPPTPLQTPMPTPLPGSGATPLPGNAATPLPGSAATPLPGSIDTSSMFNIPTGNSDYPTPVSDFGVSADMKGGRPSPYGQPPSPSPSPWTNPRAPLDVNVAYVEGRDEAERGASNQSLTQDFFTMSSGKRKRDEFPPQYHNGGYIPQQDGAGDMTFEFLQATQGTTSLGRSGKGATEKCDISALAKSFSKIPQLDGPMPDPYEDMLSTPNIYNYQGVVNEDYNVANTPAPEIPVSTPAIPQNEAVDDDDDEPLNEDDDDDLDDVDQGEELNTHHLVLAQFDKVTRTKSRWKCTLKDGIMHINNKDILFNKASGEFEF